MMQPIDEATRRKIRELAEAGTPYPVIAARAGCSVWAVRKYAPQRNTRSIVDEEEQQQICKMYRKGYPITEIMEKTGRSRSTIHRVLDRAGAGRPVRRGFGQKEINRAVRLRLKGHTLEQIARAMACSVSRVQRLLARGRVHPRHTSYVTEEEYRRRMDLLVRHIQRRRPISWFVRKHKDIPRSWVYRHAEEARRRAASEPADPPEVYHDD